MFSNLAFNVEKNNFTIVDFLWDSVISKPSLYMPHVILMVLVDRQIDGFQDEICLEWKKDKQKLETSF